MRPFEFLGWNIIGILAIFLIIIIYLIVIINRRRKNKFLHMTPTDRDNDTTPGNTPQD